MSTGTPGRRQLVRGLARSLASSTGLLLLYALLPLDRAFSARTLVLLAAGFVAIGVLVTWQVRAILRAQHPGLQAVQATALSLPVFLLMFAAAYVVLSATDPASFSEPLDRVDSLYFVITAFSTVGFGDISPVSSGARVLVTVQLIGDLVLIGLVLRLYTGAVSHRRQGSGADLPAGGTGHGPFTRDG